MKRGGPLKRRTPLAVRTGLRSHLPGGGLKRRTPMRNRRGRRRESAWRSPAYLRWVRRLPCCRCGGMAEAAHHLIGTGQMGGMGTKAPDDMTMPVCARCHREIHEQPELWEQQWVWIGRTRALARAEGWELPS